MKKQKTVYVGLSGGVDSSVTAKRLLDDGYNVVGVYIKGWYPDWVRCSWKENRRDAMRVCARLDIPFKTLDLSEIYKKEVVDYLLDAYRKGQTPNPDIMCNKHIKFGGFFEWAMKEGADFIATGHYARIQQESGEYILRRGSDIHKDQTYFLWTLTQEKLKHTLFPLGDFEKKEVRIIAQKNKLVTAEKKDSQGVCFLEDINMEEFLSHYFSPERGVVIDIQGKEIGYHKGALLYTIGQRHNFTVTEKTTKDEPYFVVDKNIENNTITVSHEKPLQKRSNAFSLRDVSWTLSQPIERSVYGVQTRYRQKPVQAELVLNNDKWHVVFLEEGEMPVRGQSLVVYDGDVCLGGGIIE